MRPLQQYCLLLLLVCYFVVVCLFVLVFYKIKFGGLKHFEVRRDNDLRRGYSLRSRRLQVVGKRENGHARGRHARETRKGEEAVSPLACLLLARPFFLVPTTLERLLSRLAWIWSRNFVWLSATKVH